ncbi:MAG: aspartyl/asparaginyl beta-hydroxylase domain-containing protein [Cyanobacteria bacterium P01_G01_bin.39]
MPTYTEYHLNPQQFPFLQTFQDCWQDIQREFSYFINKASLSELTLAAEVMGPKSKTIKTKGAKKYSAFGILFQGKFIEEYIQEYQIAYPDREPEATAEKVLALRTKYFPKLAQAIAQVNSSNDDIVRNVYFGTFHPGLDIKLHVNHNPHMNRGYLGLIVPEGDIAMKICHDKLYWQEGEFMILDHSYPHCPHNYTDFDRTVLIVDFFKPDQPREEVIRFEREQVTQRMQSNPYSLGVFGQNDHAKPEDFIKYGLAHQLEWDKALGTS